jgi:hypothetical protein
MSTALRASLIASDGEVYVQFRSACLLTTDVCDVHTRALTQPATDTPSH